MTTYSHVYSIAFEIANCACSSGLHVTSGEIRNALYDRLSRAFAGADWREACCLPGTTVFVSAGDDLHTLPLPTETDHPCNCTESETRYNHLYGFDFVIHGSSDQEGEDLTRDAFVKAASQRYKEVDASGRWQDLVGAPLDSYVENDGPQDDGIYFR